jgi:hypothetical protein
MPPEGKSDSPVRRRARPPILFPGILLAGVLGFALVLEATRHGADLTSDSIVYIDAAKNLLAGRGLSRLSGVEGIKPITHFPPLLPLVLAGLERLGIEALEAGRLLNAAAFGVTVAIAGAFVSSTSRNPWIPVLAALMVAVSPVLLELCSWIMTEPLYLMFGLGGLLCLVAFGRSRRKLWLILSAGFIASAALTRYAGVSLIVAGSVALLLDLRRESRRAALRKTLPLFLILCLAPVLVWSLRNLVLTGGVANRSLSWHPVTVSHIKRLLAVVWEWFLPFQFDYLALYVTMAAVLVGVGLVLRVLCARGVKTAATSLMSMLWLSPSGLLILYVLAYSGLLAATLLLFDATTPVDQRILSPICLSLIVLGALAVESPSSSSAQGSRGMLIAALCGLAITSYGIRTARLIPVLRDEGLGFANRGWVDAGNVAEIRCLPRDTLVYTNNLEALEFFYGRGGYITPLPVDAVTQLPWRDYDQQLAAMQEALRQGDAVLILFGREADGVELPAELILGLDLWLDGPGVKVYVGQGFAPHSETLCTGSGVSSHGG